MTNTRISDSEPKASLPSDVAVAVTKPRKGATPARRVEYGKDGKILRTVELQ